MERPLGRLRLRWECDVRMDVREMGTHNQITSQWTKDDTQIYLMSDRLEELTVILTSTL